MLHMYFTFNKTSTFLSCANSKDYVKVFDGFQSFIFCGAPNYPKLLFESKNNWITIELFTSTIPLTNLVRGGFQVFIESKKAKKMTKY